MERREQVVQLPAPLRRGGQDLLAPVPGIRRAAEEAGLFQPADDAGDGSRGEARDARQLGACHRSVLAQQVQAFVIGRAESQVFGDRVVEEDSCRAVPARQPVHDRADQFRSVPLALRVLISSLSHLVCKLYCE